MKLPPVDTDRNSTGLLTNYSVGWNDCLQEIIRLNQPGECVAVPVLNYKFKFETLVEHAKRQDKEIADLKYDANIRRFYDDGAVWFWCGDETDNLETLACPVVINAGDLRELLAQQGKESPE